MQEQRQIERVQVAFDALFCDERREGAGLLANFSYTGALLDEVSLLPSVGASVRVYVFVQPVAPFEIAGDVVRHAGDASFAIEFKDLAPELRALVDEAAAIVSALR